MTSLSDAIPLSALPTGAQVLITQPSSTDPTKRVTALVSPTLLAGAGGLAPANNLSDVANPAAARTNLGLGSSAVLNVGTTNGTVAAGDDPRITGALAATAAAAMYQTAAQVTAAVQAVVGAAPAALNTLAKIATELSGDETTLGGLVTTVAGKLDATAAAATYQPAATLGAGVVTATGGTASRALSAHAADTLSVWDFGVVGDGVADDSAALAAACTALRGTGRSLLVPGNCRLRLAGAAQVWLSGMRLVGQGVREFVASGGYGQRGGSILIDTTAASPFLVSSDWGIEDLIFHWVGQTNTQMVASGTPIAYPALIAPHGSDQVVNWSFCNNQVENAYDILDLSTASDVGHFHWERNQQFALRYHLRLKTAGGESWVTNNQFTIQAYYYGDTGGGIGALEAYAQANAEMLRIEGSGGGASATPTTAVEGMRLTDNYVFSIRYGVHVVGGGFNLGSMVANTFDGVPTPIRVDSYGVIEADVMGGAWLCTGSAANPLPAALSVTGGPSTSGSTLTMTGVDMAGAAGAGIVWQDPGGSTLTITGGRLASIGNAGVNGPYVGLSFNAPNGRLSLVGTDVTTGQAVAAGVQGIVVQAAAATLVSGVTLTGWYAPVVYTAGSGIHTLAGCVSQGSTGAAAVSGSGAGLVAQAGNRWDVGTAYTVMQVPAGQTGGVQMAGPDASLTVVASAKGGGGFLAQNDTGALFEALPNGASLQANYVLLLSGPAGVAPQIQAQGGATSIDLIIAGKGAGLVDIANANLTGTPVAPTAAVGTNNTQVATTGFVTAAVAAVGGGGGSSTVPVTVVASSGAAQTLAAATSGSKAYDITLTASCTLTLSGGTAGQQQAITVYLRQDGTAGRVVTLPSGVRWPGGSPPTPNTLAGVIDVFTFTTPDAGTTWFGSY